jgi:hypothetical protein
MSTQPNCGAPTDGGLSCAPATPASPRPSHGYLAEYNSASDELKVQVSGDARVKDGSFML